MATILTFLLVATFLRPLATAKSTIEPCSNFDTCSALVGYSLYTDLKVSELASIFSVDPISLLLVNAIDISYPDVENHILPAGLFIKTPISCSCVDGIRKSSSTVYKTRPSDTLASISAVIYGGLVSADQIKGANPKAALSDPSVLNIGTKLNIPLPCTCFDNKDNDLPTIYMSYLVTPTDTLMGLAARYATTLTDLMNVNALGSPAIEEGDNTTTLTDLMNVKAVGSPAIEDCDILAIPLSACASNFPRYASDYGLFVPNGSYAIAASHCVQCSCGPGSRSLYCMPTSLAVSCSSMQCKRSNLMLGNVTSQSTSAGCKVTSCSYDGFVNGTIITSLSTSLQPRCPGQQQFPPLVSPPKALPDSLFAPTQAPAPAPSHSPSPSESGGFPKKHSNQKPSVLPSSGAVLGFPPTNIPTGNASVESSGTGSLVNPFSIISTTFLLGSVFKFLLSLPF
ncbi:unnamed protein product [Fraxinus pennsylvanica]|uniref:LysM domain-containing protein n=1 Tax=Fraxinus pennsylvanica TaxID=56036 RepID=A0AAD2AFX5_9LAMI|nr:unnamed protein product [Fraxinus pennsylvanica]